METKQVSSVFAGLLKKARLEKETWSRNKLAPISPCPNDLIDIVLRKLSISQTSSLIDLGCGDGRWMCQAAHLYGCHCWGVDNDAERIKLSAQRSDKLEVSSLVHLLMADFRTICLKNFNIIVMYLFPEALEKIKPRLLHECAPDTVVVSIGFLIKGFPLTESFQGSSGLCAYKYTNIPSFR